MVNHYKRLTLFFSCFLKLGMNTVKRPSSIVASTDSGLNPSPILNCFNIDDFNDNGICLETKFHRNMHSKKRYFRPINDQIRQIFDATKNLNIETRDLKRCELLRKLVGKIRGIAYDLQTDFIKAEMVV